MKLKLYGVLVLALAVGGCSGGTEDNGSQMEIVNPVVVTPEVAVTTGDSDAIEVTDATDEVEVTTDTSDGTAMAVPTVSSAQMDAYVDNPLLTAIPGELNGGVPVVSSDFINNPLIH